MTNPPTSRRAMIAGAAAGLAGTVAANARPQVASDPLVLDSTSSQVALTINAAGQGASFNQAAGAPNGSHVLTCNCNATTGQHSALNLTSDNPAFSTMQVSGRETATGTIKVAHVGQSNGSDSNAAALSIDLRTSGTAAQGIFIDATDPGGTTGVLLQLRNNQTRQLRIHADGRIQFDGPATIAGASALPATPSGYLRMLDPSGRAIRVPFYLE